VTGSGGNDFIPLFTQADTFSGGNGNDLADYSHFPTPVTVDLSNFANNTGNATGDSYTSVEGVRGTSGNDHLIGNSGGNFLEGGAGADVLDGGPAGPAGTLDFASYFYAGAFGDTPASTGITADLADPSHNTGDAAGDSYININSLIGSNFADTLTGDANDNYLRGRGGADTLNGNGGSDTADYAGSAGLTVDFSNTANNTGDAVGDIYNGISNIRGSSNNDILRGDANNNVLTGGAGADTLTGNAGNDTFVFKTLTDSLASAFDTITDFTSGSDAFSIGHTLAGLGTASVASGTGNLVNDLTGALNVSNLVANGAAEVTITGGTDAGTYVVINDGTAGYSSLTDAVVKLTNSAVVHTGDFLL
jgi:Ca2+-binding RTX toxin-like protein